VLVVGALSMASGFAIGALVPIANGEFVQALPNAYRARAFGVVQGGLHLFQGAAVLITGALALRFDLPTVVGLWSLGGVALMLLLIAFWPSPQAFADAGAAAARMNESGRAWAHRADDDPAARSAPVQRRRRLLPVMGAARRREAAIQPGTMEP